VSDFTLGGGPSCIASAEEGGTVANEGTNDLTLLGQSGIRAFHCTVLLLYFTLQCVTM
jgi:hypothetical protein